MVEKKRFSKVQISPFIWLTPLFSLIFVFLFISFVVNSAFASPQDEIKEKSKFTGLQATATPEPETQINATSSFSFSLQTLGYDETPIESPRGNVSYSFRLPENWEIQSDGLLDLDLSYIYSQPKGEDFPVTYGDLTVTLNNRPLKIFSIDERELNHYRLLVPLPAALLDPSNRTQYTINLKFEAGPLCLQPHKAALTIHPTSSILINYIQRPLNLDLSAYPRPFYQQAFAPDNIRFVLPSSLTSNDLSSSLAVAAKLGDLSRNRVVISATTDIDLARLLSSSSKVVDEHLVVIGQPEKNQFLQFLNEQTELPVQLHERRVSLITQGPTVIMAGQEFTYVFTVTNSLTRTANLSVINPLPTQTALLNCVPACTQNSNDQTIIWKNDSLKVGQTWSFSVTFKASQSLSNTKLENTVTLVEAELGPVNANTLTSPVVTQSTNSEWQVSTADTGKYFFTYNNSAVAEGDGIVQEILSPWNEDRAILIITGLNDKALSKASLAMSSEARFPGMKGPVALVEDTVSPSEINDIPSTEVEVTLADLGYSDELVQGTSEQIINYFFSIPYGWQLTDEAYIDIKFSHSQLIQYEASTLNILIDRQPVASVALSEKTAGNGYVRVSLANVQTEVNGNTRLTIQVKMTLPAESCVNPNSSDQAWFLIKNTSKIFLAHAEQTDLPLTLQNYPYPFYANRALTNVLISLPDTPTVNELEDALRLIAGMGDSAAGETMVPDAILGSNLANKNLAQLHIIAIGRPSRNPLIKQVNAQLPQPFQYESDEINQTLDKVVFRLPKGIDLGYLQLLPSPWDERQAFLAVTGTTDVGVQQAVETVIGKPNALAGNLILIQNNQLTTFDTRELTTKGLATAIATVVPQPTPIPSVTPIPTSPAPILASPTPLGAMSSQTQNGTNWPTWLFPLVGVNSLIVIGIFTFVFWQTRRRNL